VHLAVGHLSPIVLTSCRCGVRFDSDVLIRLWVVIIVVIVAVTGCWCRTRSQFVDDGFVNFFRPGCSVSPSRSPLCPLRMFVPAEGVESGA
jgi:hypothetical protein